MNNSELLGLWKELKSIRKLVFQVAMQDEGMQRALEASTPGFRKRCLKHEKIAAKYYSSAYDADMRPIDAAIRRLQSS